MKIKTAFLAAAFSLSFALTNAQSVPSGYEKGSVTMANGTVLSGYVKENFRKSACISFIQEGSDKKKSLDGNEISAVSIGSVKYISISGDFFKSICEDKLSLLQKSSDASGKLMYNGADAVPSSGTAGKPGDYFTYNNTTNQLELIAAQNVKEVVNTSFPACKGMVENGSTITNKAGKGK